MKKLISTLLCLTMLVSAMAFTVTFADETEATEPQPTEYIFKNGRGSNYQGTNNPSFTIRGGWEENVTVMVDGDPYRSLVSYDRSKNVSVQYNFINTGITYSNLPKGYKGLNPGYYDLYFFYPLYNANDDSKAKVEVYHNDETTNYIMNQNTYESGSWNLISDIYNPLYFSGSGDEYVRITKTSYARLSTAGIKLVRNPYYVSDKPLYQTEPQVEEEPIEEKPLITDVKYENGKTTLVTNGSTLDKYKTVFVAVAAYDKGKLAGVKITKITIGAKSGDSTVTLNMPKAADEYKVHIFDDNNIETYRF